MENENNGAVETPANNDNAAKSIYGKLTEVAHLVGSNNKPYGRAKFTYVNGAKQTKTLTMMAFGKGYEQIKSVWNEGQEGYIYCRYEVTDKGTTMRVINKGRAPAVAQPVQQAA